jgi:hypothetical protein
VDENGAVSQVCGRFGPTIVVIAATQNCDNRSIASHGSKLGCHVLVAVALNDIEQLAFVHVLVHVGCHCHCRRHYCCPDGLHELPHKDEAMGLGPSNPSPTMPMSTKTRKLK